MHFLLYQHTTRKSTNVRRCLESSKNHIWASTYKQFNVWVWWKNAWYISVVWYSLVNTATTRDATDLCATKQPKQRMEDGKRMNKIRWALVLAHRTYALTFSPNIIFTSQLNVILRICMRTIEYNYISALRKKWDQY